MTTNEAADLLEHECHSRCDGQDVARWVRHGQVPGEAQAGGRVIVDGDGLRAMVAILHEKRSRRTSTPMVDIEFVGLVRRDWRC
jgi:hypothetical protein